MTPTKVAILTAAGSGMGAEAARRLAADGFQIAILSSSGKGQALAEELGGWASPDPTKATTTSSAWSMKHWRVGGGWMCW